MKSSASTPAAYLQSLPPDRRKALGIVRSVILRNLPRGYVEIMDFGMLTYAVPLKRYASTYNGHPLAIAALASQKQKMSAYLMCVYADPAMRKEFEAAARKAGKKPDLGKSCVRFSSVDELPLEAIGQAIARVPVDDFIRIYERSRTREA